ncbi:hypothetical protein [Pontibacter populi]|uniref:Uncharacterized protein n=1 Tax=Pontibacter populi TaxID=890055 RepID=A0ABV1RR09_9BACT
MKRSNKKYLGLLLAGALSFSFAAEAANYSFIAQNTELTQQGNQGVPQLEKDLLGPYAEINKIAATDLREAYIMLLQSVRDRQDSFTDAEWNKVQAIMKKLDARRKVVSSELGNDDKAKIKLLQGELRALETKKDIKD